MPDLYYLAFRDITSTGTGVTSGEVYVQQGVTAATAWPNVQLTAKDWVPWDQVGAVFRNKRVCFLVHGFNVPVSHAIWCEGPAAQEYEALGNLGLQITAADIVVTVMWPGDGLPGWDWFTAYTHSKDVGGKFAEFLASRAFTGSEVSFISHSLGARVVLETVAQATGVRASFGTAVLMAAAVGDNALDLPDYAAGSAKLDRIVILSSMKDVILQVFYTAGSIAEQALWSDYDETSKALGRYGPAFAAKSKIPPKTEWYEIKPGNSQDHGDYLPDGSGPQAWKNTKPQHVGIFCRNLFDDQPLLPDLPVDWGTDRTKSFRPDWTPKFPQ